MTKTIIQCARCEHNIEIDIDEIEKSINTILFNIQQQSNEHIKYLDALTFIDSIMKCCKSPYYWGIE